MVNEITIIIFAGLTLFATVSVPFIIQYLRAKEERKSKLGKEIENLKGQQKGELEIRKAQLKYLHEKQEEIERSQPSILVKTYELLIIGRPQVGKTKIIWAFTNKKEIPTATLKKTSEQFIHAVNINSKNQLFYYLIPDIGGDEIFLGEITEELLVRKPRGIIFVVDHNSQMDDNGRLKPEFSEARSQEHMKAIFSILGLLSNQKRNRCRVILFLINKQDIWSVKYTEDEMKQKFTEHISKFEKIGQEVIVECVSALTSANLHHALSEFEKILTSRKRRRQVRKNV